MRHHNLHTHRIRECESKIVVLRDGTCIPHHSGQRLASAIGPSLGGLILDWSDMSPHTPLRLVVELRPIASRVPSCLSCCLRCCLSSAQVPRSLLPVSSGFSHFRILRMPYWLACYRTCSACTPKWPSVAITHSQLSRPMPSVNHVCMVHRRRALSRMSFYIPWVSVPTTMAAWCVMKSLLL